MKIVREHTAALCVLGLVPGLPVLANQAGTNVVQSEGQNACRIRHLHAGTRDAREIYPSATVCYCTENERSPGGKAEKSGLGGGVDRAGFGGARRFNGRRASKFSTARG
jgi:hypothetical protein